MRNHFDTGAMIVIVITFVLFTIALFAKGFTQDLLLEAGVFLVSVKLILMPYNNSVHVQSFRKELQEIKVTARKALNPKFAKLDIRTFKSRSM